MLRIIGLTLAALLFAAGGLLVLAPARVADWGLAAERARSGLVEKQIEIEGFRLHYLDSEGPGEPLVLVHGFGADKDNWTRAARLLTPRYRVIAPDLPGYGESDKPIEARYRTTDQVERLHQFIAALGLRQVHLGGSSMGGHIIATYAVKYPGDVDSLWLVASGGVFSAPPSELAQGLERGGANPLIARNREEFDRTVSFVFTQEPFVPGVVREVLARRAAADHDLRIKQFHDIRNESPGLEGLITGLTVPTHILWGDADRVLHVGAVEVLKARLPQASATVMPGVGHLPMMERPEASAQDYLAFRARLAGG